MASRWYVDQGEQPLGPLKTVELRQLAAEGKVAPQTLVRRGEDGKWVPAEKVAGLLPAEAGSAPSRKKSGDERASARKPAAAKPARAALPVARPVAMVAPPAPQSAPPVGDTPVVTPPVVDAVGRSAGRTPAPRASGVPFSVAAMMAVVFLLTASLGVAGVVIYVWRAGVVTAANKEVETKVRPAPEAAGESPAGPAAESPADLDAALLAAIDKWYDATKVRAGPQQTARYHIASVRLVSPAELQRLAQPHVVRKEVTDSSAGAFSRPPPPNGVDVGVDPSFDDSLASPAVSSAPSPGLSPDVATEADTSGAVVADSVDANPVGDAAAGNERTLLLVELRVTNLSRQAALHYEGLNGFSQQEASALLVDDLGQRFLPLPQSEADNLRRVVEFEIAPGHTLTDVLVFPAPEEGFHFVRLALPNASVGRPGGVGFEIRSESIDRSGKIDAALALADVPAAGASATTAPQAAADSASAADKRAPTAKAKKPAAEAEEPARSPQTIDELRSSITRSLRGEESSTPPAAEKKPSD